MATEDEDRAGFIVWSVGLGVVLPLVIYTVGVLLAAEDESLTAPVSRGQFYLASLGLLMISIRKLNEAPLAGIDARPSKFTYLMGAHIAALLFSVVLWMLLTIQSLNEKEGPATDIVSWGGLIFTLGAAWSGHVVIRIVHRFAPRSA